MEYKDIKEIKVFHDSQSAQVNQFLSKGWVLLAIYSTEQIDGGDKSGHTTITLGRPDSVTSDPRDNVISVGQRGRQKASD